MKISDIDIDAILERHPVACLAVRAERDSIFQVPIVFTHSGGLLWSPVDGKPKSGGELARVRHIQAHPRVSLLFHEYHDDWSLLWWLRIEGDARIVQATPDTGPEIAAALSALCAKYPQYESTPVLREPATLIAIRPQRKVSWCTGKPPGVC